MTQAINTAVDTAIAQGTLLPNRVISFGAVHAAASNYGVALTAASSGQAVPVAIGGTVMLEASAAIPAGTVFLLAAADGRVAAGGTAAACTAKLRPGQSASAAGALVEAIWCGTV